MDLLITLGLIYLAYRGYRWYNNVQEQARVGGTRPPGQAPEGSAPDDYIDYEEINDEDE